MLIPLFIASLVTLCPQSLIHSLIYSFTALPPEGTALALVMLFSWIIETFWHELLSSRRCGRISVSLGGCCHSSPPSLPDTLTLMAFLNSFNENWPPNKKIDFSFKYLQCADKKSKQINFMGNKLKEWKE